MKSVNAKRIAAVAASLLMGMAVAGQGVTFGNIPIINSAGQPVVQIVIGSGTGTQYTPQPSDGVVAANIAAAIGSLAHTSQNITATVSGRSGISCVVTTPTCTLSNQQVWLGEKGIVTSAGSYTFSALIGSVLNGAVLNSGNIANSKFIPTLNSNNQYVYPDGSTSQFAITTSPTAPSAWEGIGISPSSSVIASTNGGGVTFTRFTNNSFDEVVRLTNSQVPGLLSSFGSYQESEALWLAGFPVYDQNTTPNNFALIDTQAAYQISFGKPIQNKTNGAATNGQFELLGQNWTVYNMRPPATSTYPTSSNFIVGGNVTLAAATTPVTTVYVGHNVTSGPFTVVLNDLSYPNNAGLSNAALSIYKNGVLTNVTSAGPVGPSSITVNASGTKLFITVSQTFPGLYAYQKWAKIQLFSSTFNVTSGNDFNYPVDGHTWKALLRWTTNQSTAPATQASFNANAALQGIILYTNQSSAYSPTLTPGQSINIITNPATWKVSFVGDSLGSPSGGNSNYDQLALSTGTDTGVGGITYQNNVASSPGAATVTVDQYSNTGVPTAGTAPWGTGVNTTTVTEPQNLLTVTSQLPNAFLITPAGAASFVSPSSNLNTLQYGLDSYVFTPSIAVNSLGYTNLQSISSSGIVVQLLNTALNGNYVTSSNPLTVQVTGYKPGQTSTSQSSVSFTGFNQNQTLPGFLLGNLTDISLGYALPSPGVTVKVYETPNSLTSGSTAGTVANTVLLGTLSYGGPTLLYKVPTRGYYIAPNGISSTVTYTGEGSNVNFALSSVSGGTGNTVARNQYFTFNMPLITAPTSTTPNANVIFGLTNSSSLFSTPLYWLNISNGNNNAATYQSSQYPTTAGVKAISGFRTERGGLITMSGTTTATFSMAKSVDQLLFNVGAATSNSVTSTTTLYGPYGVGQSTNIANVTIGKVTANCTFSTTSCSVTGLANLTATPSVSQAVVAKPLNTAVTPLAVLDNQANNASTLIVVGSKYVNSVAAQIFNQNPSFAQAFGPTGTNAVTVQAFGTNRILVAGYTAAQTVQAGNSFIQALLASAST